MLSQTRIRTATERPQRPSVLPGFESIKSYWDSQHQLYSARILPGEYYVSGGEEIISTVLGSCVSACVRDPDIGVGGMNHFMLPEISSSSSSSGSGSFSEATRYGFFAMEQLINEILKAGGRRENLEVKLAGGGRVICGIGVSGPQIVEGWYGQPWGRPYYRIKDYVTIMKKIWAREEPVTHDGKEISLPYTGEGALGSDDFGQADRQRAQDQQRHEVHANDLAYEKDQRNGEDCEDQCNFEGHARFIHDLFLLTTLA